MSVKARTWIATVLLVAPLGLASAADVSATIRSKLQQRFPDVPIEEVRASTRIPGMYEVFVGDSVAFADTAGERLFVGQVLDTTSRKDIGAQIMDERSRIDFGTLPFERAIKTVRGDGHRKLAVFADPDCPFCHELEKSLAGMTNVTIYTFLYPLAELHPEAPAKAHAIWCAADRSAAWSEWMLKGNLPAVANCADDSLQQVAALGQKLKIRSTPMLYAADGQRVNGSLPQAQLEALLDATTPMQGKNP
jgi:thiol:disulfide interchange protein DsbC